MACCTFTYTSRSKVTFSRTKAYPNPNQKSQMFERKAIKVEQVTISGCWGAFFQRQHSATFPPQTGE